MARKLIPITAAVALLAALCAVPASAEKLGEKSFTVTASTVLVNQRGGITISGTMDCSQAVNSAFSSLEPPAAPPAGFKALTDVSWDAYQYVGRTKVIHAEYRPGIAHPCYPGPAAWGTTYGFPVGTTQWVYSPDGKFTPGRIHVEIFSGPGLAVLGEPGVYCGPGVTIAPMPCLSPPGEEGAYSYYEIYAMSGWDLRAERK